MSHSRFPLWVSAAVLALPAWSQSVISVYSGVIHYAEGTVLLDNRPLEPKPGRFEEIKPGAELRLEEGRAEVLLTPGVFLRLGEDSHIRMVSNLLADTRIELLQGPAIIDAAEPAPDTSVTMIFRDYQIQVRQAGRYRIDSIPPELRVSDGQAEVTTNGGKPVAVAGGHLLNLPSGVLMKTYSFSDDLDNWDKDRSEEIARGNLAYSQTPEIGSLVDSAQNDPGSLDPRLFGAGIPDPSYAGLSSLGTYSRYPGLYPPSGISSYGSSYGLYPYSLYGYGYYPYSYGGLWSPLGVYPLYLGGLLTLPGYRYGYGYGHTSGVGLGSIGRLGSSFPVTPGPLHTPGYRPAVPVGGRAPIGSTPARPVHIGGHR